MWVGGGAHYLSHSCLVQGEHFLALSFLFRVLNSSSALIKKSLFILKITKILLATACKESRNYRRHFTSVLPRSI